MLLAILLAVQAPAAAPDPKPDPRLARMVSLYDRLCLRAFPDDAAVDRVMAAEGATALTPAQVKVTLVDDPGRGWVVPDGDHHLQVMLELPPFHACSVRRGMGTASVDLAPYRVVADAYASAHGPLPTAPGLDRDTGGLHIHAVQSARMLPDGGSDSLMVFEQTVTDPARRAAGETGTELRLVHQMATGAH